MAKRMTGSARRKELRKSFPHLFTETPRTFGIGRHCKPTVAPRFIRWPRGVRLQRQRAILKYRLKAPGAINQFSYTLNKSQATGLFTILAAHKPETRKEKRKRLYAKAQAELKGEAAAADEKPIVVKYGIKHVTNLVLKREAKLVVIAHDVQPLEIVLWLPALCRKMDVPYCIVKGKARLGAVVGQKTTAVLALTDVLPAHEDEVTRFADKCRTMFNENVASRAEGRGTLGHKAYQAKLKADRRARAEKTLA